MNDDDLEDLMDAAKHVHDSIIHETVMGNAEFSKDGRGFNPVTGMHYPKGGITQMTFWDVSLDWALEMAEEHDIELVFKRND